MSKLTTGGFLEVVEDILKNDKFNKLKNDMHHGISRYEHSLRVAKATYKLCKVLKLKNTELTTRAALLHDFYSDDEFNLETPKERLTIHPNLAAINAGKYFNINKFQENIIKSHMFPLKGTMPKYKESWLVTLVDKSVATYEMPRYKLAGAVSVFMLFLFNILIQK